MFILINMCDFETTCQPYRIRAVTESVYQIEEYGVYCYLVIGQSAALLIDTGTGFGDLAAAVRSITNLRLTVAATHAHSDHIGGRGSFESVFLNQKDLRAAHFYGTLLIRKLMFGKSAQKVYGVKRSAIKRNNYRTKYLPLENGRIFDLGGKTVCAVETPGHTKGHYIFVAPEDGILFAGDNICRALWMFLPGATSIETWIAGAEKTAEYAKDLQIFTAHDRDPVSAALIGKLIDSARLLVRIQKNSFLPKLRVFPKPFTDHGILYLTTKVREKKQKSFDR